MGLSLKIYELLLSFDKETLCLLNIYFENVSKIYDNYSIMQPGRYTDFNDYLMSVQGDLNLLTELLFKTSKAKTAYNIQQKYLTALNHFSKNGVSLCNLTINSVNDHLDLNRINQLQILVNHLIKNYDSKQSIENIINSFSADPVNKIDEIIIDENLIGAGIQLMTQDEKHIRWYYSIPLNARRNLDQINSEWISASPVIYPHNDLKSHSKILIIKDFRFLNEVNLPIFKEFVLYIKKLEKTPDYLKFLNDHNAIIENYRNSMEQLKNIIDNVLNSLENEWEIEKVGLTSGVQLTEEWLKQRVSEQLAEDLKENETLSVDDVKRVLIPSSCKSK